MAQNIQVADSYIARIKVDRDMGEFFEWVLSLRTNIRGRELLAAARFGFDVRKMNTVSTPGIASGYIAGLPSLDLEPGSQTDDAGTESIDPQVRIKELGWDMSFLTPPP